MAVCTFSKFSEVRLWVVGLKVVAVSKNSKLMLSIFLLCAPFQIVECVVASHPVLMVDVVLAFHSRYESRCQETVHKHRFSFVVFVQVYSEVADTVYLSLSNLSVTPYAAQIANLIKSFIFLYVFPDLSHFPLVLV